MQSRRGLAEGSRGARSRKANAGEEEKSETEPAGGWPAVTATRVPRWPPVLHSYLPRPSGVLPLPSKTALRLQIRLPSTLMIRPIVPWRGRGRFGGLLLLRSLKMAPRNSPAGRLPTLPRELPEIPQDRGGHGGSSRQMPCLPSPLGWAM